MTEIIRSGVLVEGVEITSEHIGMMLEVVETDEYTYLPVGFHAKVVDVSNGELHLLDTDDDADSPSTIEINDLVKLKWISPVQKLESVQPEREQLAKSIRKQYKKLQKLLKQAQQYNMIVDVELKNEFEISYQEPKEEY